MELIRISVYRINLKVHLGGYKQEVIINKLKKHLLFNDAIFE